MTRFWMRIVLVAVLLPPLLMAAQPGDPPKPGEDEPDELLLPGKIHLTIDPGGHTAAVRKALFTPDGKQVITLALDHTIRIWDVQTGQTAAVLRPPGVGGLHTAALSPDGRVLAVGSLSLEGGKTVPLIYRINLAEARLAGPPLKGHTGPVRTLAFSADGQSLASGSDDGTVRLWHATGEGSAGGPFKIAGKVTCLAFAPDGKSLAACSGAHCRILDRTGHVLADCPAGKDKKIHSVAWSPDGKTLATGGQDGLRLWSPDGTLRLHPLKGHVVATVAVSADSRRVLATWSERSYHRGTLIAVDSGQEELVFKPGKAGEAFLPPQWVFDGALSPDGKLAATSGGGHGIHETFLWSTEDGKVVRRLAARSWLLDPHWHAGWVPDGKGVAWGQAVPGAKGRPADRLRTFDLAELQFGPGLEKTALKGAVREQGPLSLKAEKYNVAAVVKDDKTQATLKLPGHAIRAMTLVGTDRAVLTDNGGSGFFLFDATSGKLLRRFLGHSGSVWSTAPSPDGRYLVSTSEDQTLRVWDPNRDRALLSLYLSGQDWIVWTEEGYYAASPGGEKLVGWVVDQGLEQLASFHPAQRFRKQLYRPDLIKQVLAKGSVEEALKAVKGQAQKIDEMLPPRASLRLKQEGASATIEVVAEAGSKGQPVSALHLLVDGRPARLEQQSAIETFSPAREKDARAAWTVTLEPGPHKLSVRAVAKDTYSISDEVSVEVKSPLAVPRNTRQGTLFYVGIGVNQFQHEPELKLTGAVPDVLALEKCLQETCKERFVEIKPTVLTDEKTTLSAILKTLTELPGKLKPTDVVIVHYSSHGEVEEGGGLFLLCHDTRRKDMKSTAVPGEKLREILGQYPCPVLLILDACHSGKFPLMRPATDPLSRLLADDSCGVAVMTALAHQKVVDTTRGGVFTQALIAGLEGKTRPDEVNKRLYIHHLFTYVFDTVARQTEHKQMPLYLPSGSVPPIVLKDK